MHLRRALLLFALVLGLTALATAIAPTPKPADQPAVAPPPSRPPVPQPTTVTFRAPVAPRVPPTKPVKPDARVILLVEATEGGQVEIPKLGQLATVADGDPASFDLLDIPVGRYDVLFEPALGAPARIGTLVSR